MAWTSGNYYLNLEQMQGNADEIWAWFQTNLDLPPNSVAAMLGNMQKESTINPGVWEDLVEQPDHSNGYGLVQWTPARHLIAWANKEELDHTLGETQLERIFWEFENHIQWLETSAYPMSFQDFLWSTESPYDLALAFMYNYERPKDLNQPERGEYAEYWWTYLTGLPPPPRRGRAFPLIYYLRRF